MRLFRQEAGIEVDLGGDHHVVAADPEDFRLRPGKDSLVPLENMRAVSKKFTSRPSAHLAIFFGLSLVQLRRWNSELGQPQLMHSAQKQLTRMPV